MLFIVHTDDIVLEWEGILPPGTSSHGYFNIHGDSFVRRDKQRELLAEQVKLFEALRDKFTRG